MISAEATAALWRSNAHCSHRPSIAEVPPIAPADGTTVERMTYAQCAAHAMVVLYTVIGGGHTWPGGPQYLPQSLIGSASDQLDASRTIVDFFYAHPMP